MKYILIAAAALLLPILSGCGYRIGSLMHPQINSIAICGIELVCDNITTAPWESGSMVRICRKTSLNYFAGRIIRACGSQSYRLHLFLDRA